MTGVPYHRQREDALQVQPFEGVVAQQANRRRRDAMSPVFPAEPVPELCGIPLDIPSRSETDAADYRPVDVNGVIVTRAFGRETVDPPVRIFNPVWVWKCIAQIPPHFAVIGMSCDG